MRQMDFMNGFGIKISHNYDDNYLVDVQKGNNAHTLWFTKDELRHMKHNLDKVFKDEDLLK